MAIFYKTTIKYPTLEKYKLVTKIADKITSAEVGKEYLKCSKLMRCTTCGSILSEFLKKYVERNDLTLYYIEKDFSINQAASGGGDCRKIKEGLRDVFHRILKREANKKGIELNLEIL